MVFRFLLSTICTVLFLLKDRVTFLLGYTTDATKDLLPLILDHRDIRTKMLLQLTTSTIDHCVLPGYNTLISVFCAVYFFLGGVLCGS